MGRKTKIELLAPAGNPEKMQTAFAFGADAVYAGVPEFSLRVRINNFDLAGLREATALAHKLNKKIYVTVNILAHNWHLEKLPVYIKELKKIGADALIVSDPGVMAVIKKYWPQSVIHLSTQANCTNWQSAAFWRKAGADRVILGREVTLDEIKEIKRKVPELELEYFVHGAMCMAYSGRCFLSKHFRDRSANLGDCVQPCRWDYHITHNVERVTTDNNSETYINVNGENNDLFELVEEEHGSYILNSKDLCLIEHLDKLAEAGVASFKIEGRAKSIYYLGVVVGAYRKAIDEIEKKDKTGFRRLAKNLKKELRDKLVHRGYTTGFLLNEKADQNLEMSHHLCDWEFCGEVISRNVERITHNAVQKNKFTSKNQVFIKVHNAIKTGDPIEIVCPGYDIIKMKVGKMIDLETGESIESAHGGRGQVVGIVCLRDVPEFSVVRRKK